MLYAHNSARFPHVYSIAGVLYSTDDFSDHAALYPERGASYATGIIAPVWTAASDIVGSVTPGIHQVRWRYLDSRTGYVSNPTVAAPYSVDPGKGIRVPVTASSDGRVTNIIVEMTAVNGSEFYVVAQVANAAADVDITVSDDTLIQQTSVSLNWGGPGDEDSYGHNPPPLALFGFAFQNRHIVGGARRWKFTGCTVTNGSPTITGTGFSPKWAGRLVVVDGISATYTISTITDTTITLTSNFAGMTSDNATLVISSPDANSIYWSLSAYNEAFDTVYRQRYVLLGLDTDLVAGAADPAGAYLFGTSATERLVFTDSPAVGDGDLVPVTRTRGALTHRTVARIESMLFAWDKRGIWLVGPDGGQHISDPVDAILSKFANYEYADHFHIGYDPRERLVLCFFVAVGETLPRWAAVFSLESKDWWFWHWETSVTASCLAETRDGSALILGDNEGYTWVFGAEGSGDGIPADVPRRMTIQDGATTTIIPVNVDLTGIDLTGVRVLHESGYGSDVIASNTASAVTLATGLTLAPPAGSILRVGGIGVEYWTKWDGNLGGKKRPAYLALLMAPATTADQLRVEFYTDAGGPLAWTRWTADVVPDGVTIVAGQTYATVDLDGGNGDGWVPIPIPTPWQRTLRARIYTLDSDDSLRILDLRFIGGPEDLKDFPRE